MAVKIKCVTRIERTFIVEDLDDARANLSRLGFTIIEVDGVPVDETPGVTDEP